MKIKEEFSKYANEYIKNNLIQNKVVEHLLKKITKKPKNILDLGCGSGAVYKKIDWNYDSLVGVDFAKGMLSLHPKASNVELLYADFNEKKLFDSLDRYHFDYIISASALQWANDLEDIFKNIKSLNSSVSLAIFTSNTFKILNDTASLQPLLKSASYIDTLQRKYFDAEIEVVTYKLEFESVRDIFRYIKESGVSGSRRVLNYKEMKQLMKKYPVNYLEFEVVFITSR